MKTNKLITAIATIALFTLGSNVFAQVTGTGTLVPPTLNDVNDTVTIGSTMPYRVTGDISMHQLQTLGILNPSQFTKAVSAGGTLHNALGTGAPATTDSAFSVAWGTLGAQTVSVTELPQVVSGPAFSCTANTEILNVVVINRPTTAWGTIPAGGCGIAGTTVVIPYTATGTGQFTVTYRIYYTPLSGAASDIVASTPVPNLGNSTAGTQNFSFSYAVPATAYGKYEVFMEGVTDRISKKSGIASVATTDYPVTAATFYVYPTPVTAPIQHIKNL